MYRLTHTTPAPVDLGGDRGMGGLSNGFRCTATLTTTMVEPTETLLKELLPLRRAEVSILASGFERDSIGGKRPAMFVEVTMYNVGNKQEEMFNEYFQALDMVLNGVNFIEEQLRLARDARGKSSPGRNRQI